MATKKADGSTKNGRDSGPKYLGIKRTAGEIAQIGEVIVRQRGTVIMPGRNVGLGKDHTLYALKAGKVVYDNKRKRKYENARTSRDRGAPSATRIDVCPAAAAPRASCRFARFAHAISSTSPVMLISSVRSCR